MSIYRLLPKSSIRLLKVLPDKEKGLLVCTIQHFGENDVPSYVALSYLWGNATHTKHILIDHMDGKRPHSQGIHSSLWEFLDQVYHDQMNNMAKPRDYYWTDLLCLDQTSHLEMQQQLPRMGTIYSEASRTIAWLGRAPKDSSPDKRQNLEENITWLGDWFKEHGKAAEAFLAKQSTPEGPTGDTAIPLAEWRRDLYAMKTAGVHITLSPILSLSYWTRIWVVQEVALSKKIDIVFGSRTLGFDAFVLAYNISNAYL